MKEIKFHPVDLKKDKCKGCINCMKRCPTEAIRVRDGKARIIYQKCIGCGECVRACTYRAKRAVFDKFEDIQNFKYKIALPAPALYAQFNNLDDIDYVLNGLLEIGFDDVFEVARAAEIVSQLTKKYIEETQNLVRPVISSACPAITEVILQRYKGLEKNLLPILSPVEIAGKIAREIAMKKTGLNANEIGVVFISPCPAKVHALKKHFFTNEATVDKILPINDIYLRLLKAMKELKELKPIKHSGIIGIGWASIGGEAGGTLKEKHLSADGIENCISVLNQFENNSFEHIDFVELNACPAGCVGGVANVENPFVAKSKLMKIRKYLPVSLNKMEDYDFPKSFYMWENCIDSIINNSMLVAETKKKALKNLVKIEEILQTLPLLDCGTCGAPSCRAFAEDVAVYGVDIEKCVRK